MMFYIMGGVFLGILLGFVLYLVFDSGIKNEVENFNGDN